MLNILLDGLALGLVAGIIATVYMCILPYEEFFTFWWRFGSKFERRWFFAPVWGCEKCFSGQFCFWVYLVRCAHVSKINILPVFWHHTAFKLEFVGYSVIGHVFSVCAGIYLAQLFSYFLNKTK